MGATDRQVRKLMEEFQKIGKVEDSSLKSGMSRKTVHKYLRRPVAFRAESSTYLAYPRGSL